LSQTYKPDLSTFAPGKRHTKREAHQPVSLPPDSRILVVGAGVFGSWTALMLLRKGYKVTLADSWGPGNSLSSSGGETRLIRAVYGENEKYFDMTVRAFDEWRRLEEHTGQKVLEQTGVAWFFNEQSESIARSIADILDNRSWAYDLVEYEKITELYPVVNPEGLSGILVEKNAGYLRARFACQVVVELFIKEGGKFDLAEVIPGKIKNEKMVSVTENARETNYDLYIFAAGPWLPALFPGMMASHLEITRQEVYYFVAPGNKSGDFAALPPWIEWDPELFYYGLHSGDFRGFKLACDKRGVICDPATMNRVPGNDLVERSRKYLSQRFPDLADAPLIESRVCQYSNTIDGNFIIDRHPEAQNVWIAGGGSGHGFKHGPEVGRIIAGIIAGETESNPDFHIPSEIP
jgi:glycine/D-amino acid oxidase-like deaminating enzyme